MAVRGYITVPAKGFPCYQSSGAEAYFEKGKLLQLLLAVMISHVCLAQYYYIDSDLDSYIILSYPPIIGVCHKNQGNLTLDYLTCIYSSTWPPVKEIRVSLAVDYRK